MREAFGGTWILGFVVLFIVLFSGYLAVSVNYTKAFKVKNRIINIIEENEGYSESNYTSSVMESMSTDDLKASSQTEDKIYAFLKEIGYRTTEISESRCPNDANGNSTYQDGGYCVETLSNDQGYRYYKVTTFIKLEIPIVWFNITIPITGETRVLYNAQ